MKCISITVDIDCPEDIPQHVVDWMGDNLGEHAAHEFGRDYCPEWTENVREGLPGFLGPLIAGHVTHTVRTHSRSGR